MKQLVIIIVLVLLGGCSMAKVVKLSPGEVYTVKTGETVIISNETETPSQFWNRYDEEFGR